MTTTEQIIDDIKANHGFDLVEMRCKFTGKKEILELLISDAIDAIEINCSEQPTLHIAVERLKSLRQELRSIRNNMLKETI